MQMRRLIRGDELQKEGEEGGNGQERGREGGLKTRGGMMEGRECKKISALYRGDQG